MSLHAVISVCANDNSSLDCALLNKGIHTHTFVIRICCISNTMVASGANMITITGQLGTYKFSLDHELGSGAYGTVFKGYSVKVSANAVTAQ